MKRLQVFILIFFLGLVFPLSYLLVRTYASLAQEEEAELRYFAETLFDRMEGELAQLVQREEGRAVDEYGVSAMTGTGKSQGKTFLTAIPAEPYILGYFQNDPDGSFQSPLMMDSDDKNPGKEEVLAQLKGINASFNRKRFAVGEIPEKDQPRKIAAVSNEVKSKKQASVADRYFLAERVKEEKTRLGQEQRRVEEISITQAQNIAPRQELYEQQAVASPAPMADESAWASPQPNRAGSGFGRGADADTDGLSRSLEMQAVEEESSGEGQKNDSLFSSRRYRSEALDQGRRPSAPVTRNRFQVEVNPLQSVAIDKNHYYIFRRIILNEQIYRQGFVLKASDFLNYLIETDFAGQPLARFTNLRLSVLENGAEKLGNEAGASSNQPEFELERIFPRPFSFLKARIACDRIPESPGRKTLHLMTMVLAAVVLLGLFALYHSARVIVDMSERRSGFVSSVTHELKTPLTNIRMYIEMLEQGIARDQEREQEYFRILGSESSRLSRLINNVLEFSRLERKQRPLDLQEGSFEEVIKEVEDVMGEKIRQEGFELIIENTIARPFSYDREVMIQVLINLLENSMKFSRNSTIREIRLQARQSEKQTLISVSDKGPGIGPQALKKVFDDFYREENTLTRTTKGTGIGLALVKKFVTAMGGKVAAQNNKGPGCTVTISLPN
ncbi:MAG: HAMP domain-containing histidine kinase [Proteobacteria bacterium]|nr:HAMP domain-containing histidine kinase [Pseudomonadota bacterium]MBU1711338.1 HAMP domain-containing histidine kinase [Pseudomonadota bacterium]